MQRAPVYSDPRQKRRTKTAQGARHAAQFICGRLSADTF